MKKSFQMLGMFCLMMATSCGETVVEGKIDGGNHAVPVTTATAETRDLMRSIELGGVAEAGRFSRMTPGMPGIVARISVGLGEAVKKGKVLAVMDMDTMKLQAEQGRRGLELAALQLENARREGERARELAQQGALSEQQLEQAELGLSMAAAQLAQAQAGLAVLERQIQDGTLRAPFAGLVTAIGAEAGDAFSSMPGMAGPASLVTVSELDPIRLDVQVSDRDLPWIHPDGAVRVRCDVLDQEFEARVTEVNAAAEPGSRTFRVRVLVDNPEKAIRPGFFLRASIILEERDAVVVVPEAALELATEGKGELAHLMVVEDGKAMRREVHVGLEGDDGWEVEGIESGAEVVVEGHYGLPDGSPVRVLQ